MDQDGGLPEGAVHAMIAFTFAAFLLTAALWPSAPAAGGHSEGDGHVHEAVAPPLGTGVGTVPYDGPVTSEEVVATCRPAADAYACYNQTLGRLLVGKGAVAAFEALDRIALLDSRVSGQEHALAHEMGRLAYSAYGSIQEALRNCSYKVFQGCLHGAIESHFSSLHGEITPRDLRVCVEQDTLRRSTCIHGIGHGLMLYTNANVNASLERCNWLGDDAARSCWGGVFMENLVGHGDWVRGVKHHHAHGETEGPPGYMVEREGDPYFPCSVMDMRYRSSCWEQMVDYILWRNGSDFRDAAEKCGNAPLEYRPQCHKRLGTDKYGWTLNLTQAVEVCGYGDPRYRPDCIRGIADGVVLLRFSPEPGLEACRAMPEGDKAVCYRQVPAQGLGMVGRDEMARLCSEVEPAYVTHCRIGAGLE